MKVMLVCAAFPPYGKGGGPVSSQMLAHALAEYNDVVVVTVSDKYEQWMDGEIRVRSIGSPNIYWDYWKHNNALSKIVWHLLENFNPRAFSRLWKEMRAERPDILVTVSIETQTLRLGWRLGFSAFPLLTSFIAISSVLAWINVQA